MGSLQLFEPLQGFRTIITTNTRNTNSKMVFRSDPVESPEEVRQRENMIKTAKVGKDVVKVVQRCDEAEETKTLDLSHCSLMKVPEAVTFILTERAYDIIKVNLAHNKISKITPQFGGACFLNLTSLNVSTNRLSTLPAELSQCKQLQSVDISVNNFVEIPSVLLQLESVTDINAKTNYIAEVDDDDIENSENLEYVNIEENPLSPSCRERLQRIDRIRIIMSERKLEEWEDLSI